MLLNELDQAMLSFYLIAKEAKTVSRWHVTGRLHSVPGTQIAVILKNCCRGIGFGEDGCILRVVNFANIWKVLFDLLNCGLVKWII